MITAALVMVGALALSTRWAPRTSREGIGAVVPSRTAPTDWAEFADAIGWATRAGDSLRGAFERVMADSAPRGAVVRAGADLDDVVEAMGAPADELLVVRALQTTWRLGGPPAPGMHAAASLIREHHVLRAEAAAHSAQARASARVLTSVPAVFAVFGAATSASFRAVVVTPAGATAVALGVVLNILGWLWMRRIVRRATA